MATYSAVNQKAQYGTESTAGTSVSASHLFRATTVTLGPKVEMDTNRPAGSKFPTAAWVKKEYSEGKVEGFPCWNELPGLFNWAFGACANGGVDNAYTHTWSIGAGQTRTLEFGDGNAAAKVTGAFVKSLSMNWGRNSGDSKISLDIAGGQWTDGVTATANPTALETLAIPASAFSVYMDSTAAGIGTTKVADALSISLNTGTMRDMAWMLDSSKASFAKTYETPLDGAKIELLLEASSAGRALLADLRNGATKYLRIAAVAGGRSLHLDFAVKNADHSRSDKDGLWAVTASLVVVEDETGFSHSIVLTDDNITW